MDINISEDEIKHLSQQAKKELVEVTKGHVKQLLEEAFRLEAANREHTGQPEVTRVNIKDAAILMRRYLTKTNKSWKFTIVQIFSSLTTLFAGILVPDSSSKITGIGDVLLFIIVLSLAIVFTTIQIIIGRNQ